MALYICQNPYIYIAQEGNYMQFQNQMKTVTNPIILPANDITSLKRVEK